MQTTTWRAPTFVEIRMDAEIGAYQDESDPTWNPPIASSATDAAVDTAPARER